MGVPAGRYVFYVRFWSFIGVRAEDMLAVAMVDLSSGNRIGDELADSILQLARIEGEDWVGAKQELQGFFRSNLVNLVSVTEKWFGLPNPIEELKTDAGENAVAEKLLKGESLDPKPSLRLENLSQPARELVINVQQET